MKDFIMMKKPELTQQTVAPANKVIDKVSQAMLIISVMVMCHPAFASLDGGLSKGESVATTLKDWFIRIVGIGAVIYIMWKAVETWRSRGDWGEFAIASCYVAVAGAAPAIADWLWNAFQ